MYTKTELYNLALGALLLSKKIVNADTDESTEKNILDTNFNSALYSTLEDLDLNRTADSMVLELIAEDPDDHWSFVYKYPNRAAFIRRIVSSVKKDNEDSRIPLKIGMYEGQLAIFTNQEDAEVEFVDKSIPLTALSTNAGLAVAYKLASMCSPLLVGKNTNNLKTSILEQYNYYKIEAQRHDYMENFSYETPEEQSSFVRSRME